MSWYGDYLEAKEESYIIQEEAETAEDHVLAILHHLEILKKQVDQETKEEIMKQMSFWGEFGKS